MNLLPKLPIDLLDVVLEYDTKRVKFSRKLNKMLAITNDLLDGKNKQQLEILLTLENNMWCSNCQSPKVIDVKVFENHKIWSEFNQSLTTYSEVPAIWDKNTYMIEFKTRKAITIIISTPTSKKKILVCFIFDYVGVTVY